MDRRTPIKFYHVGSGVEVSCNYGALVKNFPCGHLCHVVRQAYALTGRANAREPLVISLDFDEDALRVAVHLHQFNSLKHAPLPAGATFKWLQEEVLEKYRIGWYWHDMYQQDVLVACFQDEDILRLYTEARNSTLAELVCRHLTVETKLAFDEALFAICFKQQSPQWSQKDIQDSVQYQAVHDMLDGYANQYHEESLNDPLPHIEMVGERKEWMDLYAQQYQWEVARLAWGRPSQTERSQEEWRAADSTAGLAWWCRCIDWRGLAVELDLKSCASSTRMDGVAGALRFKDPKLQVEVVTVQLDNPVAGQQSKQQSGDEPGAGAGTARLLRVRWGK